MLLIKYFKYFILFYFYSSKKGCTCLINWLLEKKVSIQDDEFYKSNNHYKYKVHVNCAGQNLQYFPSLPKHTTAIDLSNNKV